MKKKTTLYVTQAAVIAALYVALTYASNALGLAYNAVQFRLSEILTILPIFTPAAIPGLTIGCILSNIASPYGILDIVCGSLATLFAALTTRLLRNICIKGVPALATLPPTLFNGLIVGLEIWYLGNQTPALFFISALEVMAGEVVMCTVIGIPFILAIRRTKIFSRLNA
ncbi:MAG: QueT transporter family protein [Clostridiales bacterium]|nr:QueT transporter family protein [Clostridiales bacterium]